MKIVTIVSSYRKDGNTARVVELIKKRIKQAAYERKVSLEMESINLGHMQIQTCRGCRVCFDRGEHMCPLKDDLLQIRDKISEADGIIFASPVYAEDANGIAKNWIDRMAFNNHRPGFAGKCALIVTTSGVASTNHSITTMGNALRCWGFHIAGQSRFRTGALMSIDDMEIWHSSRISRAGSRLFEAAAGKEALKPSFTPLFSLRFSKSAGRKLIIQLIQRMLMTLSTGRAGDGLSPAVSSICRIRQAG
jgi:multimeric flavodoxin WrbA